MQAPPTRRDLLYLLTGRTVTELEPTVLAALASIDGAMVTDRAGNLVAVGATAAGFAAVSVAAFIECALKVRVKLNSPSLWPTMFSVTYTGMNFLPLCTAMVCPTNSGIMVERRDQVRRHFFLVARVHGFDPLLQEAIDERSFFG